MSRFTLLLALCLLILSTHAATIGRSTLTTRDDLGPQAHQLPTTTTQDASVAVSEADTDTNSDTPHDARKESTAQDHTHFGPGSRVDESQPTPSPELVRLGPSPENLGSLLGNGNGNGNGKENGQRYRPGQAGDDDSAAGMLGVNWVLGVTTTVGIMGWLL